MSRNGKKQQRHKKPVNRLLGRFGDYLNQRVDEEHLTIRALAERAQMPHSNIHQMLQLRKNPRLTELEMLAKAFNQPLSDFLKPLLEP